MDQNARGLRLEGRGVLSVVGQDAHAFLQGLITNDMDLVSLEKAIYASFLTPQGRFFCDLFVAQKEEHAYLLDVDLTLLPSFLKKLKLYKLKSDVVLADVTSEYQVWALWGESVFTDFSFEPTPGSAKSCEGAILYTDPRTPKMGLRGIVPHTESLPKLTDGTWEDFEHLRLSLGLPECGKDLISEKSIPLEVNLDKLNAISFEKGCYLGQELIARTSHRGLVRKQLFPVSFGGETPPPGTDLLLGAKKVGVLYSTYKDRGLALIRLEALDVSQEFTAQWGGCAVVVRVMA